MDNTPKLEITENQLEMVGHVSESSLRLGDMIADYFRFLQIDSCGEVPGRLGGLARAASAFRDNFGRYLHKYGFVEPGVLDARIKNIL